ncbi:MULTISPECIES: aldo/keto reductase [Mycolicibacter]|uniref:Aldo/keto reductase n=1 Tax=Mycolicibacter virginiensis TaxID=1795032 RepID=A0A9X7NY70_9MYCO|nr:MULTISPECIES: aldo/keto reductase [Mycobacteriaceae]OBG32074.1 2,5-didehydrogluconate reductase A [Mycolicibacter heraklionensis]OBJ28957.1 2,5-didehydrogluconate reductase A [Mycolicibacter heraklionensis]PQM51729.1 aldo/keto reductase [Mycolicibacter virginiensis]ULP46195.1 aldo/keto reductase [Mycolicibacter virginiensis]
MTSGTAIPSVTLNDDRTMPTLGIGVAELSEAETERAVSTALELGCRLIDTAKVYGNEAAVGRAIAASGIPREEVFVTTKLANADQGLTAAIEACKASLERLGMDYVDLYLVHWPAPSLGMYVDSFGGLIQTRELGLARSIGVCNFTANHLDDVIDLAFETPSVNQIELHPLLNQAELRAANAERGIITQAYSPLAVGRLLDHPTVTAIAGEYGKTPAQVLIRWSLQLGNVVIPRSAQPERIAANLDVFGFELADEHMESLGGLNDGTRVREDPLTYSGI